MLDGKVYDAIAFPPPPIATMIRRFTALLIQYVSRTDFFFRKCFVILRVDQRGQGGEKGRGRARKDWRMADADRRCANGCHWHPPISAPRHIFMYSMFEPLQ